MEVIRRRIEIDGFEASLNSQKELNNAIKLFTGLLKEIPIGTKNYQKYAEVVAQLKGQQQNLRTEQRKLLNDTIATGKTGAGAYRQLSAELNKARTSVKDLAAAGQTNTQAFKTQLAQVQALDKRLKSIDASVGQFQRSVGNYKKALSKAGGALRSFGAAFGITASVATFANVLRSGLKNINDFEDSLKSLQSITGLNNEDLDGLADRARQISQQFGTAGPAVLDAFSLIGSKNPELLQSADALAEVTRQAEILSKAAGIDLPQAGNALAGFLNVYGAEAREAARFTDILATSQQLGTARIEQLAESFKNVGSILAQSNIEFEQGNALLQALAKGNIEGAEAGTKLRNIILALAKTQREELNPETQDFNDILQVLSTEVTSITDATDLFGKQNAAAALTLIQNREVVTELNGALDQTGNALAQANNNTDTLRGQTQKLTTAFNGFFSELLNGNSGLSNFFKSFTEGLTNTLNFVTDGLSGNITLDAVFSKWPADIKAAREAVDRMEGRVKKLVTTQDELNAFANDEFGGLVEAYKETGISAEDAKNKAFELIGVLSDQVNAQDELKGTTEEVIEIQKEATKETAKAAKTVDQLAEAYKRLGSGEAGISDIRKIISDLNKEINSTSDENIIEEKLKEIIALEAQLDGINSTITETRNRLENGNRSTGDVASLDQGASSSLPEILTFDGDSNSADLRVSLEENANEQILAARSDLNDQLAEQEQARQEGLKQIATAGLKAIEDAFKSVFEGQKERIKQETDSALESIDVQTAARLDAAEGNAALQEQILEEQEAKKTEIEKQAAKERKKIALKEAAIAIGLAIIKALPNPFLAAAAAIAGAAQLAIISSQQFREGGFTGHGRDDDYAGDVHKGEFVTPKRVVNDRRARPLLKELQNMAIQKGYKPKAFPAGFMEGGFTGGVPNARFLNRGTEGELMARAVALAIKSTIPEMAKQIATSTGESLKDAAPEIATATSEAVGNAITTSNRESLAEKRRLQDSRI